MAAGGAAAADDAAGGGGAAGDCGAYGGIVAVVGRGEGGFGPDFDAVEALGASVEGVFERLKVAAEVLFDLADAFSKGTNDVLDGFDGENHAFAKAGEVLGKEIQAGGFAVNAGMVVVPVRTAQGRKSVPDDEEQIVSVQ